MLKLEGMPVSCVGNLPASLHEMQNKECVSFVRKRTVCMCVRECVCVCVDWELLEARLVAVPFPVLCVMGPPLTK